MSRILFICVAIFPATAVAHVGAHHFDASGTLLHAVSQSDHTLSFIAALTVPVAAGILIWKRYK